MRILTFFLAALILAGNALAARPDVRQMTCQQARKLVRDRGAVVATTGQYTYMRFVIGPGYCDYFEWTIPATSKTRDNPRCVVGYQCVDRDLVFPSRGFRRF